jgi:hypothetical protein
MGIRCYHCSSEDTHFKKDILGGCCQQKKQGEEWFCRDCKNTFKFYTVYSEDEEASCCGKQSGDNNFMGED